MRRGQERTGSLYRTPDSEQHRRQSHSRTSAYGFSGLGWTDRIPDTRIGRRLPRSRQHDATRAGEGDASRRGRSPLGPSRGTSELYARDHFDQHLGVSCLHRDAAELRHRCQGHSANGSTVAQGHGYSHGCRRHRRRTRG